jgi:hypothetical protein
MLRFCLLNFRDNPSQLPCFAELKKVAEEQPEVLLLVRLMSWIPLKRHSFLQVVSGDPINVRFSKFSVMSEESLNPESV